MAKHGTEKVTLLIARALLVVAAVFSAVPGLALLLGTATWRGRALGLWALATAWLCLALMGRVKGRRSRQWRWAAGVSFIAAALLAWGIPDGGTENVRVRSCFIAPDSYRRWHPLNWISEADWAALGLRVLPWIDESARHERWRDVQRLAGGMFVRAAADVELCRLGSCLHFALEDIAGSQSSGAHYFAVLPDGFSEASGKKYPVVVFLHGWLGNMSVYPLLLRGLADQTGAVVLIPSCGMGTWIYPDAPVLVSRVLADAAGRFPLDPARVTLGGISNGGRGVYQTMAVLPDRFAGAFFVTAMLDPMYYGPDPSGADRRGGRASASCDGRLVPPIGEIDDLALAKRWGRKRVLVISANGDVRVPGDYTQARVRLMKWAGLNVQTRGYDDADHWLFFRRSEHVITQISQWMAADESVRENPNGRGE